MAPRDSSAEPTRRHRERESGERRKHRHKKRGHSSSGQQLSMDALAQLNDYNTRDIVSEPEPERQQQQQAEQRRRKQREHRDRDRDSRSRPRRDEYRAVETDYESPRVERPRRRAERDEQHRDSDREYERERRRRTGEHRRSATRDYDSPRAESSRRRRAAEVPNDDDASSSVYAAEKRERRRRRESAAGVERDDTRSRERSRKRDNAHYSSGREYDAAGGGGERRRKKKAYPIVDDSEYDSAPPTTRKERRHAAKAAYDTEDYDSYDDQRPRKRHSRKKSRLVSGAIVEEGRGGNPAALRGGAGNRTTTSSYDSIDREKVELQSVSERRWPWAPGALTGWWHDKKKRKWFLIGCAIIVLLLIIIIAVAVSQQNKSSDSGGSSGSDDSSSDLNGVSESDIPTAARGTYLDPFTWYETTDFNVTYTNETVGDLPIMGLNSEWDDSVAANDKVPALNDAWGDYASTPARGVNLGGWLSLEPFITPSLFDYDTKLGIVDEWTLCTHLGARTAASTLEKHYATFVTEQDFIDIRAAGLDHVRIPFSYWAVETYDDDPYVFRTSWRYLLRGIEWARQQGLRVKLDLHALPGSQNGWNHSGRLGPVGWLNGTDGELNRQRSLDVHDRLSKFFAQDRYKNVIAFYGLANEPRMVDLSADAVVQWTTDAYALVRQNGMNAPMVFGDGFMGLGNWQGRMTGYDDLVLDVHQYVIFNNDQIVYTHQQKVKYACDGWTEQTEQSMDTSTGYGPTMFAEWSQADTDCARHLTNVGWGNRWEGTYASGNASSEALTPRCPTTDDSCSCDSANADVADYSDEYKTFLKMFAQAQMVSFEKGWGWWYWTWDTESAPLWSYKKGLAAGILPAKAYDKDFDCTGDVPDFGDEGLPETY